MIASKYPIMEANFYKFRFQGGQLFMRLIDYGCVMAKLDLGIDKVNYDVEWKERTRELERENMKICFFEISVTEHEYKLY